MASDIDTEKEEREQYIFNSFASCCRLNIKPTSIASRRPPEPDIFCELESGCPLQFEMVEVLDIAYVKNDSGNLELQRRLNEGSKELDIPVMKNSGVLVGVNFEFYETDNRKRAAVPATLREAAKIPLGFTGRWQISDTKLRKVLTRIFVTQGEDFESEFHVGQAASFADPIIETISTKGKKRYDCEAPIDLLAYYDRQPAFLDKLGSEKFNEEIQRAVAGSQFSRVWVYNSRNSQVVEVNVRQKLT